jgi:hypothetical protein
MLLKSGKTAKRLIKLPLLRISPNIGGFSVMCQLIFIDIYSSYAHHMGNWKRMANKAPAWVRFWKNDIMEKLL